MWFKTALKLLWKNKMTVITVVQTAIEYAPRLRDYVGVKIKSFKNRKSE
jgi:hypothetical protein